MELLAKSLLDLLVGPLGASDGRRTSGAQDLVDGLEGNSLVLGNGGLSGDLPGRSRENNALLLAVLNKLETSGLASEARVLEAVLVEHVALLRRESHTLAVTQERVVLTDAAPNQISHTKCIE